ncbi:PE-PPE domain-containing protein [[Mycobacterium] nativiensis]|uniref:PE-PPE domain-containing protein n=1 Tax=[Mycobacterium] nativiensis TaxID=2855503 RepID=A0ABU5XY93_9MYCO|nr:PE-PPE domain-containing protein [Mycolicibacter sp. MYC340]MEB3032883.1 PE-PPE domain-containing protein [Mycolicibacter sp. MYC340]
MKRLIIGAALCGAALALAAGANAANQNYDFLYGSTDALVLGPTGISTPSANYINHGMDLYLDPLGYQGTAASTLALTTPNSYNFLTSVPEGEKILVDAILADFQNGDMGCNNLGVCTDPLTIFTYSQSSLVAANAQDDLIEAGVPANALRFVMLGATPAAVPTNLYPTEVFNIQGDIYATHSLTTSWIDLLFGNTSWQDVLFGMAVHNAYLGLTADQIASATSDTVGMTTFNEIPELTMPELFQALFNSWFAV